MTHSGRVRATKVALLMFILIGWELLAGSGLLFQDVVPSLRKIAAALGRTLSAGDFYHHLATTGFEVGLALLIGGGCGLIVGLALGTSQWASTAWEPYIEYLAPTPKIIFFSVAIMWFGVGPGSKIGIGALSCFFPVVLSVAAGMRQIDPVLIRVGRSFRLKFWQMTSKIYLPAMRTSVLNGARLGLGVAIVGVLLAETKLSNQGLGYLIIQSYGRFDMPEMYALLLIVFLVAGVLNESLAVFARHRK